MNEDEKKQALLDTVRASEKGVWGEEWVRKEIGEKKKTAKITIPIEIELPAEDDQRPHEIPQETMELLALFEDELYKALGTTAPQKLALATAWERWKKGERVD